jgi:hypothetical protein
MYKLRCWHSSALARENRSLVIFCKAAFSADLPFEAADEISIWVNADHVKRNSISVHLECLVHQQQQSPPVAPFCYPAAGSKQEIASAFKRMKIVPLWRFNVRCRGQSYGK